MPKLADWQYTYRNSLLKLNSEDLFGVMLDANADLNEGFTTYRLWYAEEAARQVLDRLMALGERVEELEEENSTLRDKRDSLLDAIESLEEELATK